MTGELEFTKERNFISFLVIFLPARGENGGRITFSKKKRKKKKKKSGWPGGAIYNTLSLRPSRAAGAAAWT